MDQLSGEAGPNWEKKLNSVQCCSSLWRKKKPNRAGPEDPEGRLTRPRVARLAFSGPKMSNIALFLGLASKIFKIDQIVGLFSSVY